jgi:CHAT domain-containing protein
LGDVSNGVGFAKFAKWVSVVIVLRTVRRVWARRGPVYALTIIGVSATALIFFWLSNRRDPQAAQLSQMKSFLRALEGPRVFEARIAGILNYHPFISTSLDVPRVYGTSLPLALLEKFAKTNEGSASGSAALGIAGLFRGTVDKAVDLLRDAVYLDPQVAEYWCDLSAAHLIRGRPTDLLEALESSERALQLQPHLEEARFNRALAFEQLGLLDLASTAWRDLESVSQAGDWRAEANAHEEALDAVRRARPRSLSVEELLRADPHQLTTLVQTSVDDMRLLLEDQVLPRLGGVCQREAEESCEALLNKARAIALAIADFSEDRQPLLLADQLRQWGPSGLRRPARAEALISYGEARVDAEADRVTASAELFRKIEEHKGDVLDSIHANAVLYTCLDRYYQANHAEARQCLQRLDTEASRRGFSYLMGRIDWLRAQVSMTEGGFARAASEFDRAIVFLNRAHDRNQVAAVESLRATLLDQLGDLDGAWRDRINAIKKAQLTPRRRHTLLNSASRSCLLQRLPRAALDFEETAVQNALEWRQPGALVESYLNRANVLHNLGRIAAANDDLRAARNEMARVEDQRARTRFEGELVVIEGEVLADAKPTEALQVLTSARQTITNMQFDLMDARLQYAIGIASEQLGRRKEAQVAYRQGVGVIERQRRDLTAMTQVQSLDLAFDMYEHLIAIQLADGGPSAAFLTAESSRAQVLRHNLTGGEAGVSALEDAAGLIPDRAILMYFEVLESETVRWTISHHGVTVTRAPTGRRSMEFLVRNMRRAVSDWSMRGGLPSTSQSLSRVLVPDLRDVPRGTAIVFVPDGPLHDVPFAALVNPSSGKYLIQDYAVGVIPSLSAFVSASRVARDRYRALNSALIVKGRTGGSPGADPLPPLPAADEEVGAVAHQYAQSHVLLGKDATRAKFLAEAGSYPVIHFTGHAVANRLQPDLSRLYLEPSAGDNGWLLLRDIDSASFDRTALVVLGACETGAGPIYRGEGVLSMARPFLGRGVAGVVSSLWDVADSSTARLLTSFHRGLRAGLEPIVALQRAQREQIESPFAGDTNWAAFQYVGGIRGNNLP